MKIYDGAIWKQFIISCLAMDYSYDMIKAAFKEKYGRDDLTDATIATVAQDAAAITAEREQQLKALDETTVTGRIDSIAQRLETMLEDAHTAKDKKLILATARELKGYLEMLAKIAGELRDHKDINVTSTITADVSYSVLEKMERDGILNIRNKDELKKLMGV